VSIGNPEVSTARDAFRALIQVHRRSSRYIKRVLARVTEHHPATVGAISDDARLRTLALGRLAASERHPRSDTQKNLLGDYYDIAFVRIGVGTLRGDPIARTQLLFAELTETYLRRLFDFCFRQVEQESGGWTVERDRIGIFLSGGNARGRPYDEDHDLIVLLDSDDPSARVFADRVLALMNSQIARRGVITQYRLGGWIGHFVVTLNEVIDLLQQDRDELFVDRCQVIGSRMVLGSRQAAERLVDRVLKPYVFTQAETFVPRLRREVVERRKGPLTAPPDTLHLKESPGGLREIDLALASAKARLGVWGLDAAPFAELARRDPARAQLYRDLGETDKLLVAVRSAYRVAVAASDEIERKHLDAPARLLGYEDRDGVGAGACLFAEVDRQLRRAAAAVDELTEVPVSASRPSRRRKRKTTPI
jgi:UTP:GlnB (protein PII) uridylyltransferase